MVQISYLSLIEIFRDFAQLVAITVQSLGIHIDAPMKFSFLSISDWLSLNFVFTVGVDSKIIMAVQFCLVLICTVYLIIITIKEANKHYQGVDIQSMSKFQKYLVRAIILLITTIFAPLVFSSLKYFSGKQDVSEKDKGGMFFFSAASLLLLVIVNPIIFYYGIKNTRPRQNTFDQTGRKNQDEREIYFNQLKRHNNPFKELYNNYSHKGAYYKLLVMLFKFVRMCLLITDPTPYKSVGAFWGLYVADIIVNSLFLIYSFKIEPYHDYRTNRSCVINFINQIAVIFLNIILLCADNEQATNSGAKIAISVLQLLCCLIFCVYYFKILFSSSKLMTKFYKMMFKEISFTSLQQRGINGFSCVKNRFLNYMYFNSTYYNKEEEILIIWYEFWRDLIKKDKNLQSKTKVEELLYANPGNAPPSLQKFQNTAEERLEENTRIIQKIGYKAYQQELENNEREEYKAVKQDIFNYVPPVDAYYRHHLLTEGDGFCKVNFFPFPFTCQLVYDSSSQVIEVQGEEYLKHLAESMKTESYRKMREFRLRIRTLNEKRVKHSHYEYITKTRILTDSDGKTKIERQSATVHYTEGVFYAKSEIQTIATLPNKSTVDVGKGLICSLYYKNGRGTYNSDNTPFTGDSLTLSHSSLGVNFLRPDESGKMTTIINENKNQWVNDFNTTQMKFTNYSLSQINQLQVKADCLSYDFNIRILGAPINVLSNRFAIQELLQKEKNVLMQDLMTKYENQFNALYNRIQSMRQEDYKTYLYLLFKDIWTQNQDLSIVKKNEDILNPDKETCLIHQKDQTIQIWKEKFLETKLRSKLGRGYFGDKLLRNLQKMIDKFGDKPENFINQSDILSIQQEPETKLKTDGKFGDDLENDLEKQNINPKEIKEQKEINIISINEPECKISNLDQKSIQKEVSQQKECSLNNENKEINKISAINRRTSIENNGFFNQQIEKDIIPDEEIQFNKQRSSSSMIAGESQMLTKVTIKQRDSQTENLQEININ